MFRRHVSDTLALLNSLAVTKASLIGSWLGGIVAMVIAATNPDRVERLVLNDIGQEINVPTPKEGANPPNHIELEFHDVDGALECYKLSYRQKFHAPRREWLAALENQSTGSVACAFVRYGALVFFARTLVAL